MQIQYFNTAWADIRNSQGWFGKLCLLALVGLIPIFGQIVVLGYLYGWAREIAWGVHEPLPPKIFGNEDGKLYRRGWFILVVTFVFALIPSIVTGIGSSMGQVGYYAALSNNYGTASGMSAAIGSLIYFIGLVGALLLSILAWIGSMRVSIYDQLPTGFQLGKIWKMFRHDTNGILRIFGMNLLVGLIVGIVLSILITFLMIGVVLAGLGGVIGAGYSFNSLDYMSDAEAMRFLAQFVTSAGLVGFFCLLVAVYATSLCSIFVDMLVARALGYWTLQFDVPSWRGKDDPMPFEFVQQAPQAQQYQQPATSAPVQQPVATPVVAPVDQAAPPAVPSVDQDLASSQTPVETEVDAVFAEIVPDTASDESLPTDFETSPDLGTGESDQESDKS